MLQTTEISSAELFSEIDNPVVRTREVMIAMTLSNIVLPPKDRPFRNIEQFNSQADYIKEITDVGFIKTYDALVEMTGPDFESGTSRLGRDNVDTITKLFIEGETAARWDRYNCWLPEPINYWTTDEKGEKTFVSPGYNPGLISERLEHQLGILEISGAMRPQALASLAFKEIQRSTRLQISAETKAIRECLLQAA